MSSKASSSKPTFVTIAPELDPVELLWQNPQFHLKFLLSFGRAAIVPDRNYEYLNLILETAMLTTFIKSIIQTWSHQTTNSTSHNANSI